MLSKENLHGGNGLPVFLAPHYFCACSDLYILCAVYNVSSYAERLGILLESSSHRFSSSHITRLLLEILGINFATLRTS